MAPARSSGPRRPESLLQLSGEPVFLLSPTGRLLYANPAWEELTGHSAAEFHLRDNNLATDELSSELLDSFRPPPETRSGSPASTTTLIRRPDGQRLLRRIEVWPHHDRDGHPLFLLGIVRPLEATPLAPDSSFMRLRAELWMARERLVQRLGTEELVGQGPAHRRLIDQIETASTASLPVLIVGPPGSGKRQVARTIHRRGGKSESTLVSIDCAALPPEFLERELFGPSASLGVDRPQLAMTEDGGLLLREIVEMPRDIQARLAEALSASDPPRVRLFATTVHDPEVALRSDRLRPDLYFALTSLVIRLSPLQDRIDELPLLAQHFLDRANRRSDNGSWRIGFLPEALEVLIRYDWPGNLRELARVVELAHHQSKDDLIGPDDLPATIRGHLGSAYLPPSPPEELLPLDETLERVERHLIERALRSARGNKSLAAKFLHVSRTRLHRRIQELGLAGEPEPNGPENPPSSSRNGP